MATIVTVHGTGATGPAEGEKWWQKGSPFEAQMREMVQAEDGELNWQPVIWDGANSETSRRAAGKELYGKMQELEARGEPYSVIGHSHGGSVVSAALIEAAGKKNKLDYMRNWLTVGTPFIESRKSRFLFTRLGLFGKSAYIALLSAFLIFLLGALLEIKMAVSANYIVSANYFVSMGRVLLIMLIPFISFYILLRYLEGRKFHLYKSKIQHFAKDSFNSRWVSLWHANDEAVQGLRSVGGLKLDLFPKDFAINPISFLSIFFVPALLIAVLISPVAMKQVHNLIAPDDAIMTYSPEYVLSPGKVGAMKLSRTDIMINLRYTLRLISQTYMAPWLYKVSKNLFVVAQLAFAGMMLVIVSGILVAIAFVTTVLANFISRVGSLLLSKMLNPMTMSQLRATAYGSDRLIDHAIDAQTFPMWTDRGQPSLPDDLANNIQAHADAAAGKAIPKFRAAASFALASDKDSKMDKIDILSDYLTWDELIHTSYFTNPYFVKLVGYGLVQGGGFKASQSFLADPHYGNAANWHKEIVGGRRLR